MRVMLIAEVIGDEPWHPGRLAALCGLELARRGIQVQLVCESIGDASHDACVDAGVRVLARRDFCYRLRTKPRGYEAFIRRAIDEQHAGTVAVSLSPLIPADIWMPIQSPEATPDWRIDHIIHDLLLMKGLRRRLGETRAFANAPRVRRFLALAPRTARPRVPGCGEEGEWGGRVINIGYVSTTPRPSDATHATFRRQVRDALGLDDRQRVILTSADGRRMDDLQALFVGLAHLHRQRRTSVPALVVCAHESTAVQRRAERAGLAAEWLRIVSTTTESAALLAGTDFVAVTAREERGGGGSPARLLCDALVFGKPVLAERAAAGAELLEGAIRAATGPVPGLLVAEKTATAWYRALAETMEPAFATHFGGRPGGNTGASAARALADLHLLTLGDVCDRIVRACGKVAVGGLSGAQSPK